MSQSSGHITICEACPEFGDEHVLPLFEMLRHKADVEGLSAQFTLTAKSLTEMLWRAKSVTLIAFWDGEPAAMANFNYEDSTFTGKTLVHITDLYTKPEFERRGIAKALLRYIAEHAIEQDFDLKLVPLITNEGPIEWYKTLGARHSYAGNVLRVDDVHAFLGNLTNG